VPSESSPRETIPWTWIAVAPSGPRPGRSRGRGNQVDPAAKPCETFAWLNKVKQSVSPYGSPWQLNFFSFDISKAKMIFLDWLWKFLVAVPSTVQARNISADLT
jgi:hypothetical protein